MSKLQSRSSLQFQQAWIIVFLPFVADLSRPVLAQWLQNEIHGSLGVFLDFDDTCSDSDVSRRHARDAWHSISLKGRIVRLYMTARRHVLSIFWFQSRPPFSGLQFLQRSFQVLIGVPVSSYLILLAIRRQSKIPHVIQSCVGLQIRQAHASLPSTAGECPQGSQAQCPKILSTRGEPQRLG